MRVIHIYECLVSCSAKVVIEFTLCRLHTLKASESKKMRLADICDKSEVRKCDINKLLDVARMTCSHLYNCNLSCTINLEQCQWNTDAVVEIALCSSHIVFH